MHTLKPALGLALRPVSFGLKRIAQLLDMRRITPNIDEVLLALIEMFFHGI